MKNWDRTSLLISACSVPMILGAQNVQPQSKPNVIFVMIDDYGWADMGYFGIGVRKYYQDHNNELQNKFYNCCLLRLPEIYLNIAEAMNELGKAEQKDEFGRDAYDYINLLRDRVQMPHVTKETAAPGEALREAILRERALEFGYEEVRYYDMNRWKRSDWLKARKIYRLRTYPVGEKVNGNFVNFRYEFLEQSPNPHTWIDNWDDKYYLCPIPLEEIKSLNPQYKRNIVPGNSKPYTLRLPTEAISSFIDNQDTIYNHRSTELFKNRRTVASVGTRSKATAGDGELTYYKIKQGDTLGTIARKFGVSVRQLRSWNGLRNNNIRAGRRLKIYK